MTHRYNRCSPAIPKYTFNFKSVFIIKKTNDVAEDFASILLCIVATVKGDSQGPFLADTYIHD